MTAASDRATSAPLPDASPQAAALAYAARGWPVFPCDAEKHPLTAHGFKDACTDEAAVRSFWKLHPRACVGIATGGADLVVIDVDVKKDAPGPQGWRALLAELGEQLEDTAIASTPSGGRHIYYRCADDSIPCSASRLASGIDVRARGGYVIAPPSTNLEGIAYEWLPGHGPEQLAVLPAGLAELLTEASTVRKAPRLEQDNVIKQGMRNSTLASLAGSMRRRAMTEAAIEAALLSENQRRCDPPLPDDEVRTIAASIAGYPASASVGAPLHGGSDTDNAERFITMFGERTRYCALEKSWYIYDGSRWARDELLRVEEYMRRALLSVFGEAARAPDDTAARETGRSALRLQSAQARRAALECARSDPRISVRPTEFDRHPWLLNCTNGTLDLRSGELRRHDPADLIRQRAPVEYDARARSAVWERYLDDVTGGDCDLRDYLQRAVGYSLTGDPCERVFFLLLGPTTSGKSTLIEALNATLADYAHPAGIEAFLQRTSVGGARPDIAALVGRRLVTGVEVDRKRRLDEVLIKQLVGGDTISERDLYARAVPFVPQCTLWLAANEAPQMDDTDDALWVRARIVPFSQQIPDARKDKSIKATLRDPELAGAAILAWAVRGCFNWRRKGLGTAPAVQQATRALRLSMDPLEDFMGDCCRLEPGASASNQELRLAYRDWLGGRAPDRIGAKEWGTRLRSRGLKSAKVNGQRGYRGIGLRP